MLVTDEHVSGIEHNRARVAHREGQQRARAEQTLIEYLGAVQRLAVGSAPQNHPNAVSDLHGHGCVSGVITALCKTKERNVI